MTPVDPTETIGKLGLIHSNRPEKMNALNNTVVDGKHKPSFKNR